MGLAWPVLPYHPLPNSSVLALEFCRRDKQIIALKSTERLPLYLSISIQLQNPKLLGGGGGGRQSGCDFIRISVCKK